MKRIPIFMPLLFLVLIFTVTGIMGVLFFQCEKQALLRARVNEATLLAKNLSLEAVNALVYENAAELAKRCKETADAAHVVQALVIDTAGYVKAHNNPGLIGKKQKKDNTRSKLFPGRVDIRSYPVKGVTHYRYTVPVIDLDTIIGAACVVITHEDISGQVLKIGTPAALIALISIGGSLGIFLVIFHLFVTKPLNTLRDGLQKTITGNYHYLIKGTGNNKTGNALHLLQTLNKELSVHKELLGKAFSAIHSPDTNRDKPALVSQLAKNIDEVLSPRHTIIALVENNTLIIKCSAGFDSSLGLTGKHLVLPNDEFLKIFSKQSSREFPSSAFSDTFGNLGIDVPANSGNVLIAPVMLSSKSKGILMLIGKQGKGSFTEYDLLALDIISTAAALSLFHIELLEIQRRKKLTRSESYTADIMRRNLLPQKLVKIEGIETCSLYKPADDTHGNWYGFVENREKRQLSVFIGDAVGTGMQAVLVAATANNVIKTINHLAHRQEIRRKLLPAKNASDIGPENYLPPLDPAYLLSVLNHVLYTNSNGKYSMTLFASTIDLEKMTITFANAGHEIPVLIRKKSGEPLPLACGGPGLGDTESAQYDSHTHALEPEDVIIWHTLGLTQCTNSANEPFGKLGLLRSLKKHASLSSRAICKNITHDVFDFKKKSVLKDDITLITAKIF